MRDRQQEAFAAYDVGLQAVERRQAQDRQVEPPIAHLERGVGGVGLRAPLHGDPRMLLADRAHQLGEGGVADVAGEPDPHGADLTELCRACGATGDFDVLHDEPRRLEQRGARGGQPDRARRALEQRRAELAFERTDALAQGWLGDMQAGRRATEVQLLGDREKRGDLAELHVAPHLATDRLNRVAHWSWTSQSPRRIVT